MSRKSYRISVGIAESELKAFLEKALEKYGYYEGKAVNFSKADVAPVVMCTVLCGDEILLVKRGYGLADANGVWSTVNGFIDEIKPVRVIAAQELREELSLEVKSEEIKVGKSYTLITPQERRNYITFPCLIVLESKPEIKLDFENTDFAWIKRSELDKYEMLEDLPFAIDSALKLK